MIVLRTPDEEVLSSAGVGGFEGLHRAEPASNS
jgi:hypothetical protein